MISTELDASQDFRRALSLLSTNSWDSRESKSARHPHPNNTSQSSMQQPLMHVMTQGLSHASPQHWRTEQQSTESRVHISSSPNNGSSHFQDFQLFKAPYESGFYSNRLDWPLKLCHKIFWYVFLPPGFPSIYSAYQMLGTPNRLANMYMQECRHAPVTRPEVGFHG